MTTKQFIVTLIGILAIAASGFFAGYTGRGMRLRGELAEAYDNGRAEALIDVSECSLAEALERKCTIPCVVGSDCMEKNGVEAGPEKMVIR